MPVLNTNIDTTSDTFKANHEAMQKLSHELRGTKKHIARGGSEAAREKHIARGKLLVRDRIHALLDKDSPFLEIGAFAAFGLYDAKAPSAGVVAGIGQVHGRDIMIVANDATVKGGTYFPLTVKKHLRAQEIALENALPCIYLVDSGGAFLPMQDEVFADKEHFGRIFYNQARLSAAGLSQIAVVMGSCTAGGAYVPAMCDEAIIVDNQGTIFLAGPPLVKAATGEDVDAEELGGGRVHCKISGVTDHLAKDDHDALEQARNIIERLGTDDYAIAGRDIQKPALNPKDMYGIVSKDPRYSFDVREIIGRTVDGSEFQEFKRLYGKTLVCGFARIWGHDVGIVANNGILFCESAQKGAHFVQLCNQRGLPIVFLQNVTGFMVGKRHEHKGIAKDGAKMVNAVATCHVPKLTVIIGGSFGAGNYAMCGRAYGGRFLWSWPNSRISVMGGDQAASVLTTVKMDALAKQNKTMSNEDREAFVASIRQQYDTQGHSYYASARLWDDGIIDPLDTRETLGLSLNICQRTNVPTTPNHGVFRM